jgi:AcrR family transcriptional regulator
MRARIDCLVYSVEVTASTRRGRPPVATRGTESSRHELLDAAAVEFAAHGYAATTVDRVVRRAGLSKGTFYWNFGSKEALFVTLLEERLDAPARGVLEVMHRADPGAATGPSVSRGLADLFTRDPELVRLLHEYWSAATRDERHAVRYRRRHAALREAISLALGARHQQTGVPLAIPAEELADAFIALAIGLGMAALVEPGSIRAELFGEMASLVYDGMVRRAESGRRA